MNVNISIEVSGDIWYNEDDVVRQLAQLPGDVEITLNLNSEGPSLYRLGIAGAVNSWLEKYNLPPSTITVTRWSNAGEDIPYRIFECSNPSHFWKFSQEYLVPPEQTFDVPKSYLFGLFMGRATVQRNVMLYQIKHQWPDRFLTSRLPALRPEGGLVPEPWNVPNFQNWRLLETLEDWAPGYEQDVIDWFDTQTFTSLDGRTVRDQYGDPSNHFVHNRSMLTHYHKFDIELVSESYTLGQTFFPTEKTARPIAGTKPWLIYAAPNYIQHLKNMGFQSLSSLWDESYDQFEGPVRWKAMQQVIQQLVDLNATDLNSLLTQAHKIALHNRLHLETLYK